MTMPVSAKAVHNGSHSSSFHSGRPIGGRVGRKPQKKPAALARRTSATASSMSSRGTEATQTKRGECCWNANAQSLRARQPSLTTRGVRTLNVQMPSEGYITSPHTPSSSRSLIRATGSLPPMTRLMKSSSAESTGRALNPIPFCGLPPLGRSRRNSWPSM